MTDFAVKVLKQRPVRAPAASAAQLFIHHDGERYTLRRASKGKSILTK